MDKPYERTSAPCRKCGGRSSIVKDSRLQDGYRWRRRLCCTCKDRTTTYEITKPDNMTTAAFRIRLDSFYYNTDNALNCIVDLLKALEIPVSVVTYAMAKRGVKHEYYTTIKN